MKTDKTDIQTPWNVVDHLVEMFFDGKQSNFKAFVDRPQSTVGSWKEANAIPHKVMRDILRRAALQGLNITADDFFPPRQGAVA